jgi:hypothetical protein
VGRVVTSRRSSGEVSFNGYEESTLKVAYGHIIEMAQLSEDEEYYVAIVVLERTARPVGTSVMVIPLEESPEFIAATYGAPEDLVGRRVRIEHIGWDVTKGVGRIVAGRSVSPIGTVMELPSRGFRFAAAGQGGV